MKFMTWNVNGIRALIQYHPYCDDLHKSYKEILDYLDADVICLQETKITRPKLDSDLALVPGYESYWSFHKTKSGYSGVAIYIKDHIKLQAAEEGISGILGGLELFDSTTEYGKGDSDGVEQVLRRISKVPTTTTSNGNSGPSHASIGSYPSGNFDALHWTALDQEGRGLVLDFGMFVLFNLYCPNETDETRLPFKMAYYHLLENRVRQLIESGRQVIVLGDMNVIPTPLDHADPEKSLKDWDISDFGDTPPRRWFNQLLGNVEGQEGVLVDLFRTFHPDEKGQFTCWNTKINARPSNYGTRLDYILVTKDLVPWFTSCYRLPHIVGSDHCPVVAEMSPTIQKTQEQGEELTVQLQDVLDSYKGGTPNQALAAKYYQEFSGKQQKLSSFFVTKAAANKPMDVDTIPQPSGKTVIEQQTQPHTKDGQMQPISANTTGTMASPSRSLSATPVSSPSRTATSISVSPSPLLSSKPSSSAVFNRMNDVMPPKNKKQKTNGGQTTLSNFFKRPTTTAAVGGVAPTTAAVVENPSEQSSLESVSATNNDSTNNGLSQESMTLSQPSSSTTTTTTSSSQEFDTTPATNFSDFLVTNHVATTNQWNQLFSPKNVPTCRVHQQPATRYTVNKKGPNKGRHFFLCSLPVGPSGNTVGQNPNFRCNFFQWLNPGSVSGGHGHGRGVAAAGGGGGGSGGSSGHGRSNSGSSSAEAEEHGGKNGDGRACEDDVEM